MSVTTEPRTLHFDFSCFSQEREFTLLAGGGRRFVLRPPDYYARSVPGTRRRRSGHVRRTAASRPGARSSAMTSNQT